jgi:hypothetical protein
MRKLLMAFAVGAIAAVGLVAQEAQARCSLVTVTASGATQGIATRKAERRLQRHVTRNLAGARVGHARTNCQGWGTAGVRPVCKRSAIVCS